MFAIGCNHDAILETASLLNAILPGDDLQRLAEYIVDWRERKGFHTPDKFGKCDHKESKEIGIVNGVGYFHWCPDCGGSGQRYLKPSGDDPAEKLRWEMPKNPSNPSEAMIGKLMLVVTEVAEAAEAVRHEDWDNFVEEIADTFIRLLDITGSQGIDIKLEIDKKMRINEGREIRHGKKTRL